MVSKVWLGGIGTVAVVEMRVWQWWNCWWGWFVIVGRARVGLEMGLRVEGFELWLCGFGGVTEDWRRGQSGIGSMASMGLEAWLSVKAVASVGLKVWLWWVLGRG